MSNAAATRELARLLEIKRDIVRYNKIRTYYPDEGPLRRELYAKHTACFAAGKNYRTRATLGANRSGKSEGIGCYETVLHMTGLYPNWWVGRRFDKPITGLTVAREPKILKRGVQKKLFGGNQFGEGMYPKSVLDRDGMKMMQNGNGAYEYAPIKHVSGGWSEHYFGTYKQGREGFESIELDWFHEDEEAPEDIHDEIVMRTMTTDGCGILTYTPLKGLTALTQRIWDQKDAEDPDVHVTNITWDDVPHLTEEQKADLLRGTPGYLRDARSKGIPAAGIGRIYPVDPQSYTIKQFHIPDHFRRVFGIDCGWHMTAAVWGAYDKDNDTLYIYSEHYLGEQPVPIHAAAIKARGIWIPGVGDVAGASQTTGEKFHELYKSQGVRIKLPDKGVDGGIGDVMERLSTGRLKIMDNCQNLLKEMLSYSYDEKQNVIKHNDHACFVAGTIVETEDGPKAIERIQSGEYVWTRNGLRVVTDSAMTSDSASVLRVTMSNGATLVGTANHPVLVGADFKRIDALRYGDILHAWQADQKPSFSKGPSTVDTLTRKDIPTASTLSPGLAIARKASADFTRKYGWTLTGLLRSLMGSSSTTPTMMPATTSPTTSLRSRRSSIANTTRTTSRPKRSWPHGALTSFIAELGTVRKRAEHGIVSMAGSFGRSVSPSLGYASSAGSLTNPSPSTATSGSALTRASRLGVDARDLMTCNASVVGAAIGSLPTSTISSGFAPVTVESVERLDSIHPVFNLTVDGENEYFASGVLVHNCDALRYLVVSGLEFAVVKRQDTNNMPIMKPVTFGL